MFAATMTPGTLTQETMTPETITPETITPETIDPVQAPDTIDTDSGDHDRFAHYCKKDDIMRALVTGEAITALCGKKWVPTRDPERFPICPTCVERKAAGWTL
ncbi:MAG: DUF3039 domain-containing protein [Acidimicrobiia bacterium]|nr:DUF3039 domain-containing protein [Acidimicrobiia bacterium]